MKVYTLALTQSELNTLQKTLNYARGLPDINEDENAEFKNDIETLIDELTIIDEEVVPNGQD